MTRKVDPEILAGFVEEVKGYLPQILQHITDLRSDSNQPEKVAELHRCVHCIKGASAMVGLSGLSHVAYHFEEAVEDVQSGKLPLDEPAAELMRLTVAAIDDYVGGVSGDAPADPPFVDDLTREFRLLRGEPEPPGSEPAQEPAPPEPPLPELVSSVDDLPTFGSPAPTPELPEPNPFVELSAITDSRLMDDLGLSSDDLHDLLASAEAPTVMPDEESTGPASSEEVSPELLEVFALEAEDHLRTIHDALPRLERQPGDKTSLQEIRRSAHTLKGAAAMVGFRGVTQLAHRMEDLLDQLYEGNRPANPEVVKLLFASTDALEDLAAGKSNDATLHGLYGRYDALLGAREEVAPAAEEQVSVPTPPEVDVSEPLAEVPEPAPAEELAIAADEPAPATGAPRRGGQFVRVPIERLDDLVKLVSELVIARTAFEQRMADFQHLTGELGPSSERLRRVAGRLESQYEARALASGRWPEAGTSNGHRSGNGNGNGINRLLATFKTHGFDDLEFDRYTEFHLLSRELGETTSDVQTVAGELGHLIGDFDGYLNRQSRLHREIEDKLRRLRMVPLATLAPRLHRTVRNVAQQCGKDADLVLEGESTELDKTVLEQLADPLLHLLRNAVDHGVEQPEVRRMKGKPAKGTVRLHAFHEGSQVVVRVADDGAGLDLEAIRQTAVERGLVAAGDAALLDEAALAELVFQPGFSTARELSEISGRGVGLDVVREHVSRLKGSVTLDPRPGQGARFTIRLPMTLAITRALLVRANQETFALPLEAVRQILRLEPDAVEQLGQEAVLRVGKGVYPLLYLGKLLGLKQASEEADSRRPVLILQAGEKQLALVVDGLIGGREIVIKNLGSHLRRVRGVTGATLMGDGGVVLILNPAELLRPASTPAPVRLAARPTTTPRRTDSYTILIVDDSPSVRRVVANLIKSAGWNPQTAKDGLEALELLHRSPTLPDLVLLDIEMPRMDGYELLATLRAQDPYQRLPVVFVTSRANEKHRRKALDLGASGYVIKPYQDDALLQVIRDLVRESRQTVLA